MSSRWTIDLLPKLSFLFSRVLIPKAVRADLFKRRSTKDRLRSLFARFAFLKPCDEYDQGTVDFLLAERLREGIEDRGEAEAVVQAVQLGATVIVDDPWGRELAARDDLDYHGTLWVLQQFFRLGLLSASELRNCLVLLRRRLFRLPWDTVNEFLVEIGEAPIDLLDL